MNYKIQYNACGLHTGWKDLLDGTDGETLTFHNRETDLEGTDPSAEDHIEQEQEDYDVEDLIPDYRIVTMLEGDAETELRSMVKELIESFDVDSLDHQQEVERRASDLLELLDKEDQQ
jgi:hypothetical protein